MSVSGGFADRPWRVCGAPLTEGIRVKPSFGARFVGAPPDNRALEIKRAFKARVGCTCQYLYCPAKFR